MKINEKGNADLKKRITLLSVVLGAIVPLAVNFGLKTVYETAYADITMETLAEWLDGTISAITFLSVYIFFALLINSELRFGTREFPNVIVMMLIRLLIVYVSALAVPMILKRSFSEYLAENLATLGINLALEIVLILIVIGVAKYLKKNYIKFRITDITLKKLFQWTNPLTCITFWSLVMISIVSLSGLIAETYAGVSGEQGTFEIILPYIKWAVKTVAAYFVMHFTGLYLQKAYARASEEE